MSLSNRTLSAVTYTKLLFIEHNTGQWGGNNWGFSYSLFGLFTCQLFHQAFIEDLLIGERNSPFTYSSEGVHMIKYSSCALENASLHDPRVLQFADKWPRTGKRAPTWHNHTKTYMLKSHISFNNTRIANTLIEQVMTALMDTLSLFCE